MEKTLQFGYMVSDGKNVNTIEEIRKDKPVAIFLHGCKGFNSSRQFNVMRMIDYSAFEVVGPESFVRAKDRITCQGRSMRYRAQDIRYAIRRVKEVSDQPIILVGFSEGGRAVAEYSGDSRVIGKAVLANHCPRGIDVSIPAININGRRDKEANNSLCPISNAHYIDSGHDVSHKAGRDLLRAFMKSLI